MKNVSHDCTEVLPYTIQMCMHTYVIHKAIIDDRPSLALMHIWHHNACSHCNACLTSWSTLMEYFGLSPYGEESLNEFLSPDPDPDTDHLRGGPSHGCNTSCVKQSSPDPDHLRGGPSHGCNTSCAKQSSPDPDHLRGGPSHGCNTSCAKKSSQSEQSFFSDASRQSYRQSYRQTESYRQTNRPTYITLARLSLWGRG